MSYQRSQVAFIDTETTGLHPEFHSIWDIAIIIDEEEYRWQNWVDSLHVDEWVKENTRFGTEYDPETALAPFETARKLEELLQGRHLVGACPWFDSERLHALWRHYGDGRNQIENHNHPWHYHLMDVECLSLGFLAGANDKNKGFHELDLPIKSDSLFKAMDIASAGKDKHTAIGDARKAKEVFEHIFGEGI